jgi:hypothetical protein
MIEITCTNSNGARAGQSYVVSSYNNPHYYQPVFTLSQSIKIPDSLWEKTPYKKDYPIQVIIELVGTANRIDFDVMMVYDEA